VGDPFRDAAIPLGRNGGKASRAVHGSRPENAGQGDPGGFGGLPFERFRSDDEEAFRGVLRNVLACFRRLGSAVIAAGFPELGIGFVGVSVAFGLTVLTMAYAVGHISGGHFNPAVSLGLAMARRFSRAELPGYGAAQVAGLPLCWTALGAAIWMAPLSDRAAEAPPAAGSTPAE
jgi:hypothetical protein